MKYTEEEENKIKKGLRKIAKEEPPSFKDWLNNFTPLTEKEQKAIMFALLDDMDFIADKIYKTSKKAAKAKTHDELYEAVVNLACLNIDLSTHRVITQLFQTDKEYDALAGGSFRDVVIGNMGDKMDEYLRSQELSEA